MILVDVEVPVLNQVYDFQTDEYMLVGLLLEELSGLISQKEQVQLVGNVEELMLWDKERRCRLMPESTLSGSGVRTGGKLLLL